MLLFIMYISSFSSLTCPACGRFDFSSRHGFINHVIFSHQMNFFSLEEWDRACGVAVPVDQIPLDDPCRRQQIVSNFSHLDRLSEQEVTYTFSFFIRFTVVFAAVSYPMAMS
jgi:hypothetical protein